MKILTYLFTGVVLLFLAANCENQEDVMEITGNIQEQGMTSYQYGTHTITNEETFYAIKSEAVNLNEYIGRSVTIKAQKIEGYPLSGGPEYLRVLAVEE